MKLEIKRIALWPVAKLSFVVYFVLIFVVFLLYGAFFSSMFNALSSFLAIDEFAPKMSGGMLIFSGLFLSLFLSAMYSAITVLAILVYNAFATRTGGISFQVDDTWIQGAVHEEVVTQMHELREMLHDSGASAEEKDNPSIF